ncbi:S-layer homology domain-containing protein [Paenibacillus rigui]|uniref:SLH domain-containing protein n=1 Tax=Paenibacillus rigui TaxID=554312 RepID=A0A229UIG8_9BACL|nr:S-layer homology domain-containing protein [Paenibacillus rigui]OXM83196.1 hypothetical protein CF651_27070 [Paenibacillus rigui]
MFNGLIRKGTTLLLTLCLIVSSFGMVYGAEELSDVKGHWAEKPLTDWIVKNRIQGYEDGSFKPDHAITRAEFMALVNRSFGLSVTSDVYFTDLKSSDWNYTDVRVALGAGYIEGYEDHTIRSMKAINREEAVVMISRLLKLDTSSYTGAGNAFTDGDQVAAWSKAAVEATAAQKIVEGYTDTSFKPKKEITRAEAVVMLDRALAGRTAEVVYNREGTYGPESGQQTISGNVVIEVSGVKLQNTVIEGNLLLASGIQEGDVFLTNVTVKGTTTINGGGANSVHFKDSMLGKVIVNKKLSLVRIVLEGTTRVQEFIAQTQAQVELSIYAVINNAIINNVITFKGQGTIEIVTLNDTGKGTTFEKQPGNVNGEGAVGGGTGGGSGSSGSNNHHSSSSGTGTVTGYVYDAKLSRNGAVNKGASGVTVSVYSKPSAPETLITTVTTDANGQYSLNLVPGSYYFTYQGNGYLPRGTFSATAVITGQTISMEAMELYHTALLLGARDNSIGSIQRVFGAIVTVTINNETFTEESNVDGAYFIDLPVGTGTATVTAKGYNDAVSTPFEIIEGKETRVTVYMKPLPATVSGTVYEYGTGLKQGSVAINVYQMTSTKETLVQQLMTDDNGQYSVNLQPWMHYRFQFTKNGYAVGDTPIYVNIRPGTYALDRAMAATLVYGNVAAAGSSGLGGVHITTVGQATYTMDTDAYGNYLLFNLPEGIYTITASKDGYDSVTTGSFEVTAQGTVKMPQIRLNAKKN